jgi:8-oxo-dGTP pyrophosphatase MutT (NUDIX family)
MGYEVVRSRPGYDGALVKVRVGTVVQPGGSRAAQRELAEEAQLRAAAWRTLAGLRPSPGISTGVCRVYQAGQLDTGEQAG